MVGTGAFVACVLMVPPTLEILWGIPQGVELLVFLIWVSRCESKILIFIYTDCANKLVVWLQG